jgi:hypothetical protein
VRARREGGREGGRKEDPLEGKGERKQASNVGRKRRVREWREDRMTASRQAGRKKGWRNEGKERKGKEKQS